MSIRIVDLYSGNERDTMADIAAQGFTGVIFKAGQGMLADVPRVRPHWWQEAKDAGLMRGWYWLCDSRIHSSKHMDEIHEWKILDDVGELGLWVDIEKPQMSMTEAEYWKTPYAGYKNLVDFVYLLKLEIGTLGAYSGPGAYELVTRGAPQSKHDYLAEAMPRLWTAQYPYIYVPGISKPSMYGSWKTWALWQYRAEPDINVYNGTYEEFYNLFGGTEIPPAT
jgi:hypothetical protein